MNRRRGYHNPSPMEQFIANLKDYIVPIIGIMLVLILIWSFFLRGSEKADIQDMENRVGVNIDFSEGTEAEVQFTGGKQAVITAEDDLYKGETLKLKTGRAKIVSDDYVFNINERGELQYNADGTFTVENGDIWLDTKQKMDVVMRYATVNIGENSHVAFTQNEVGSTVYLVSGSAEVKNNAGKSTVLAPKEKIEVSRKDATDEDADLGLTKEPLGDFFLNSEWFILNNGASYLVEEKDETEKEEEKENKEKDDIPVQAAPVEGNDYLTFGNLVDSSTVTDAIINVYGNYSGEDISKIVVNNTIEAKLNKEQKSFNIEGIPTGSKTNDIVFKVYDGDNKEISRFVYTIYNKNPKAPVQASPVQQEKNVAPAKTTFDANPVDYLFTAPTQGAEYTTTEDFITIRGKVSDKRIDKVIVNNHKLSSYNGLTWRYHAQEKTNNLQTGTNIYSVEYYSGDNLVYKNSFTIIKQ